MKRISHLVCCALSLVLAGALAQGPKEMVVVTIGKVGEYRITLKGMEIRPKDLSVTKAAPGRPIWLASCEEVAGPSQSKDGDLRTWCIRFAAWRAGEYDLRDLLAWPEGFNKEMQAPMIVTVADPLPADYQGRLEPAAVSPPTLAMLPARPLRWGVYGLWTAGVLWLGWRGWLRRDPAPQVARTAQDAHRRRLLEGLHLGQRSPLTPQTRAELQRQFLILLVKDFGIQGATVQERLAGLNLHPEGARLMALFDGWVEATAAHRASAPAAVVSYLEHGASGAGALGGAVSA